MDSILPQTPEEETPSILPQVTTSVSADQYPDRYLREIAERYAARNNLTFDEALEKTRALGPQSLINAVEDISSVEKRFIEEGLVKKETLEDLKLSMERLNTSRQMVAVAGPATDKVEAIVYDEDIDKKYQYAISLLGEKVSAKTADQGWAGAVVDFIGAVWRDTIIGMGERLGDTAPFLKKPLSLVGLDESTSDRAKNALSQMMKAGTPEEMEKLATDIVNDWDNLGFLGNNAFLLSDQLRSTIEGGRFEHPWFWTTVDVATLGIGKATARGIKSLRQGTKIELLSKAKDHQDYTTILKGEKAGQESLTQALANPNTVVEVDRHSSPDIFRVADPGTPNVGLKPVVDNELSQKVLEDLNTSFRDMYTTEEGVKAAADRFVKDIQARTNAHVVDVLRINEGLFDNYSISVKLGKADGVGWEDYFSAEKFSKTHGGTVFRDEKTNTFFVRQDSGLSLKGISDATQAEDLAYRSTIKAIVDFNNRILSPEHTSTVFLNTLLKRGEAAVGRAYRKIWVDHQKKIEKLSVDEGKAINNIALDLRDGVDSTRRSWYNDSEFSEKYYMLTGQLPRQEVVDAYKSIWAINDAAFYMAADTPLKNAINRGEFIGSFDKYKNLRMKAYDSTNIPREVDEIFDVDRGSFIQPSDFKRYQGRNLLMVPDGIKVGNKEAKYVTGDLVDSRQLRHTDVLGYQPGGMRGTAARHYSVQEVLGTQIGGRPFVKRGVTWFASMSAKDALKATKDFNAIIAGIRRLAGPNATKQTFRGLATDDALNALIRANNGFNPSIETVDDFIKFLDESGLEIADVVVKNADEAVPDIDIGKAVNYYQYGGSSTYGDLYRLNSNPSSPTRNRVTHGYGGRYFDLVDPISGITKQYAMGVNYMSTRAYFKNAMEGLVKNGEDFITNWDKIKTLPLLEKIKMAEFRNDAIGQAFARERQTILDRMSVPGVAAQKWEHFMAKMSERMFDKGNDTAVKAISIFNKNPVVALRSGAFGMAFGFWNTTQYLVQLIGSSMAATIVPPKYGLRAFLSYVPMRFAMTRTFDKPLLNEMYRRVGNAMGMTRQNWDDLMYYMKESGKYEINLTTSYLDANQGLNSGIGRILKAPGIKQVRDNWTAPFREGELSARLISVNVAFREFVEKFPNVNIRTREGWRKADEYITNRADALTFNMTKASQAAWQKGGWSLATQWQAINARFLENLFFSRSLSKTEKLKLLGSQVALYGAAGVNIFGLGDKLIDETLEYYNITPSPEVYTFLKKGGIDGLVHTLTGVPTNIADRLSFFNGMSETINNIIELNLIETIGGPSYSFGGGTVTALVDFMKALYTKNVDIMAMDFEKLVRQVSGINVQTQAYYLWRYGEYVTRNGRTTEGIENPKTAAILTALGFKLQQIDYQNKMQELLNSEQDRVDDLVEEARRLNTRRYDLMNQGEYERSAAVSENIYALREVLPPEMQMYFDKKTQPFLTEYSDYLYNKLIEFGRNTEAERLRTLSQPQGANE